MIEKTKRLLFFSGLMQVPFIAVNLLLDVILYKHFGASAYQISFVTTMRPLLAVLAFYWGSVLLFRPQLLRISLVIATAGATFLFLFAPWAESIWYFIIAEGCYVLFLRAAAPAQMEILKINIDNGAREKIFSQSLSLSHSAGATWPPARPIPSLLSFLLERAFCSGFPFLYRLGVGKRAVCDAVLEIRTS